MGLLRRGRPWSHDRREGAAAVEFALVVPLLLLLLFGIITFGVALAQQLSLTNAARQGARVAVVNTSDRTCGELLAEVQGAAGTIGLSGADVDVLVERVRGGAATTRCPASSSYTPAQAAAIPCADSQANDELRVSASFDSALPLLGLVVDRSSITLTGVGVYRCEFS